MDNRRGPRLFGALLLIAILLIIGIFVSKLDTNALMGIKPYTKGMLETQLNENMVTGTKIEQKLNSRGGSVIVTLKDGQEKVLYVTDTAEIEEWLRSYGLDPEVSEVPGENWFISLLPTLIMAVVCVFFFVIMLNMMSGVAGGGSNSKLMDFGKSRAKMIRDNKKKLSDVAGLEEEKEGLDSGRARAPAGAARQVPARRCGDGYLVPPAGKGVDEDVLMPGSSLRQTLPG